MRVELGSSANQKSPHGHWPEAVWNAAGKMKMNAKCSPETTDGNRTFLCWEAKTVKGLQVRIMHNLPFISK